MIKIHLKSDPEDLEFSDLKIGDAFTSVCCDGIQVKTCARGSISFNNRIETYEHCYDLIVEKIGYLKSIEIDDGKPVEPIKRSDPSTW